MRIDAHTHFLPAPYRELLHREGQSVRIEAGKTRPQVVHTHGSFPLFAGFYDLDSRREWMQQWGIDHTIASVSTPNPNEGPQAVETTVKWARAINDGFADVQADHPDRISCLGSLPFRDPEAATAEVDRIVDLGLRGVAIPTSVRGRSLADGRYEAIFDAIDGHGLTAFVHPQPNALSETFTGAEGVLNPVVIFPTETTVQVARLIFDGFFDRWSFDVVLAHMGGALPYLLGRLERGRRVFRSESDVGPREGISTYLERVYYDTISFHPPAIELAIETVGIDRLVFGSDHPFGMEDIESSLADIDSLDLTDDELDAVMHRTAATVYDLDLP